MGRLVARKQPDLLVRAWAEVSAEFPDWELVIVGDGGGEGDSVEELVRRLVNELRVERCVLTGHRNDVSELLSTASLFAFPSVREGLPNVVLEAMAAGVPVLAARSAAEDWFGELPPLVTWNGVGTELAGVLRGALSSSTALERIGESGRAFVCERHSVERCAAAYRDVLLG